MTEGHVPGWNIDGYGGRGIKLGGCNSTEEWAPGGAPTGVLGKGSNPAPWFIDYLIHSSHAAV